MKKNTALAVMENFQIADHYEGMSPELLTELWNEMEDLDPGSGIIYCQIKVPSGGGIAYEVQGEDDGDAEPMKEIEGVIVFTHRLNGYWPGSFGAAKEAKDKIPVCSSMDGKTGLNLSTGETIDCYNCPYNQYGTGVDEKGRPSRGKTCKNMRRIYLMMDNDPNVYLLTVPPTSIQDVNNQLARMIAGGVPYRSMVVSLTLDKAQNNSGVVYSKVAIKKKGLLPPAAMEKVQQVRLQVKSQCQSTTITMDECAAAPTRGKPVDVYPDSAETALDEGGANFEEAPPITDEDVPF